MRSRKQHLKRRLMAEYNCCLLGNGGHWLLLLRQCQNFS